MSIRSYGTAFLASVIVLFILMPVSVMAPPGSMAVLSLQGTLPPTVFVYLPLVLREGTPAPTPTATPAPLTIYWREDPSCWSWVWYRYEQGFLVGYTAYAHFGTSGGAGNVEFTARIQEWDTTRSTLTRNFAVEGGVNYTLVVEAATTASNSRRDYMQIVTSPSASSDCVRWVLQFGPSYHYPPTIYSMSVQLDPY